MLPFDIPLSAASNLRDLGGWPVRQGGHVRRGLIYRAPALTGLCPEDSQAVARLGIVTVCDLRAEDECRLHPVHIQGAIRHALPVSPWQGPSLATLLATGQAGGGAPDAAALMAVLHGAYRAYALDHTAQYAALFRLLLDDANLPLLLHCSAGKDRTGFGAALLLSALGVAWRHVVEDYLATNRLWRREIAARLTFPDDVKEVLLGAHEALLTSAFDALRETYGSLDSYLEAALGLSAQDRTALRQRLVG